MVLRPGNAGSNTAADHLSVLDRARTQIPDRWRSKKVLIRADGAGYSHALSSRSATPSVTRCGTPSHWSRPGRGSRRTTLTVGCGRTVDVIEVTNLLELSRWTSTCPGMPVIVRWELPHPGVTLDAFDIRDGYRDQAFTTNTTRGQLALSSPSNRGGFG